MIACAQRLRAILIYPALYNYFYYYYSCPQDLKSTAYLTLVRPHLECSLIAFVHYAQELKDQIERVQRRSARFVCKDYKRTSSVTSMLKSLQWDILASMGNLTLCSIESVMARLPFQQKSSYTQLSVTPEIYTI